MDKIQNRDAFLNKLAGHLGRQRRKEVVRPIWKFQPQWNVLRNHSEEELLDVLEQQCQTIHTDFIKTDYENLKQAMTDVIEKYNGKSVIINDDQRFSSYGLLNILNGFDGIGVHIWDSENGKESIRIAEQADIGITFSDITLAESGTVVLFSGRGKGRSVSLLPKNYVSIIPKSTIVPRLSQATRDIHRRIESEGKVASCVNFVTGPSNSADIEMNLVVGVHGPIRATYIVVEDR